MPKSQSTPQEPHYIWPWSDDTPGVKDVAEGKAKRPKSKSKLLSPRKLMPDGEAKFSDGLTPAQKELEDPNWEPARVQVFDQWAHLYDRNRAARGNVARFVRERLVNVRRSQRELPVKDRIDYGWASYIRLVRIARGSMVMPYKHVREVAKALDVDFRSLLFVALHEYTPDLVELLGEAGFKIPKE